MSAKTFAIASLPLLLLLPAAPLASASSAVRGSGTYTGSVAVVDTRTADGNTISAHLVTLQWYGDFVGTSTYVDHVVIHADGSFNWQGNGTTTGSFEGSPVGTCTLNVEGQGAGLDFHGSGTMVQCDGGLTGINFQSTFTGSFTSPTTKAGPYNIKAAS